MFKLKMLKIAKWVPYFGKKYLHRCTRHTAVWLQLEKTLILGWCFLVFTVALLHVGGMLWLQCSPQNVCHMGVISQYINLANKFFVAVNRFRGVQPTNLLTWMCITWGLCHTEERTKDKNMKSSDLLPQLPVPSQKNCTLRNTAWNTQIPTFKTRSHTTPTRQGFPDLGKCSGKSSVV